MDIKQLQCFVAVARELNFTSAAAKLYVSQPTLSRHIRNLENELGIALFARDKKNVELTNAGVQLLTTARDIIGSADEFSNTAADLKAGKTGYLRIGYQLSAWPVVPEHLCRFCQCYPGINVSVEEYGAKDLMQKLSAGELDIIFSFSIIRQDYPVGVRLRQYNIYDDDMAIFVGKGTFEKYRSIGRAPSLTDFAEEKMIMISKEVNPGYDDLLQTLFREKSIVPKTPIKQPTLLTTLMLLVKSDLGVSLLPLNMTLGSYPDCRYFKLCDVKISLPIVAVWREMNFNSSLRLLLKTMMTRAGDAEREDLKYPDEPIHYQKELKKAE